MSKPSVVYVLQEPPARIVDGVTRQINLGPATKFGELVVMLPPGDVVISTKPTVSRLRRALSDFTDDDYLLLLGDPVAISMAGAIAAEMNGGRYKALKWDRQMMDYLVVKVDLRAS